MISLKELSGQESVFRNEVIMGVDAAWTVNEPSGVALIQRTEDQYRIIRLGRSYQEFVSGDCSSNRPRGSQPNFEALLEVSIVLGHSVNAIALDIPLSSSPITGRRICDSAISRAFGGRGAATHSPSVDRPGPISEVIRNQLLEKGYAFALTPDTKGPVFLEVYPHTAILELFGLGYRLPYKVSKRSKYWPNLAPLERKSEIIRQLNLLHQYLSPWFVNLHEQLPPLEPSHKYEEWQLKGQEDLLDALVAALTGGLYLTGKAEAYGDHTGVIWVPQKVLGDR